VAGEVRPQATPIAGELGALPYVPYFCSRNPKHRPVVEKREQTGRQINKRFFWRRSTEVLKAGITLAVLSEGRCSREETDQDNKQ
jgi:hypothetical protein